MKKLSLFFILTIVISCTKKENNDVERICNNYMLSRYCCQFEKASTYTTPNVTKKLHLFASNLTDDELDLMRKSENGVTTEINEQIIDEDSAWVNITVFNTIISDSISGAKHIGSRTHELTLVRTAKHQWLICEEN